MRIHNNGVQRLSAPYAEECNATSVLYRSRLIKETCTAGIGGTVAWVHHTGTGYIRVMYKQKCRVCCQ